LTRDAQEALLKTLEGTPGHVWIILATTEPNRLKDTLRRRCHQIVLNPIDDDTLFDYLNEICDIEEVSVPEEMIELIIEGCEGSPGKALALMDAIIDLDPEDMEKEIKSVQERLSKSIDLCRALIKKAPWKQISAILKDLKSENAESIRRGVLGYCVSILLKEQNPRAFLIASSFADPFYDNPFEQLVLASFECLYGDD
jgi:DNA polymerase-3 subunit gamma/tau